jgi:sarcosine oxidase subunit alpha
MLASAVSQFVARYALAPGKRAVLFANNDEAYASAFGLLDAGVQIEGVVDPRPIPADFADALASRKVRLFGEAVVCDTKGYKQLSAVQIRDGSGKTRWLACDLLAVSGGYNSTVHLFPQSGVRCAMLSSSDVPPRRRDPGGPPGRYGGWHDGSRGRAG